MTAAMPLSGVGTWVPVVKGVGAPSIAHNLWVLKTTWLHFELLFLFCFSFGLGSKSNQLDISLIRSVQCLVHSTSTNN